MRLSLRAGPTGPRRDDVALPLGTLPDASAAPPRPATLQDRSGPEGEGETPRAMRAFTSTGALSQVFRCALAEASGECSPWQETEGADGRSGLCATATCQ